ncbi:MAG TPA: preprotein translocase subunit YajC [Gammaproteobacteria bacterium]|jgi:preprotein translocase subunit YajC
MSFFISDAYAAGGPSQDNGLGSILIIVLMMVAFYFLLWRPQQKRTKEHQQLLSNLGKGDEVATSSGIHGRVKGIDEQSVTVEIAKGVEVKMHKQAVTQVLPKGTLKHL